MTAPTNTSLTTGNDTHDVVLTVGAVHNGSDFGFVGRGVIGDFVFFDHNGDGMQNGTDSGYPGVTVTLTGDVDGDGLDETFVTTTDGTGNYTFPGLPHGTYAVTLTPPDGTTATLDADGGNDNTSSLTLDTVNPSNADQDFALTGSGTIGDTIFYDLDGDGTQGLGEPGIPGVTVTIDVDLDGDGNPDFTTTATTDQNGNYTFANIPAGTHTVRVTVPAGSNPTSDLDGDLVPDADNRLNLPAGGRTTLRTLAFWAVVRSATRCSGIRITTGRARCR